MSTLTEMQSERNVHTFSSFVNEDVQKRSDSAGIAIVLRAPGQNPKIMLVHPANGSWQKAIMGIPKGKMEDGEEPTDTAFRETFEELGIRIAPDQVGKEIHTAEVWSGTKFMNNLFYLVCEIEDPSEIGLPSLVVPKAQLQQQEVDWAGFIDIMEAYGKVPATQRIILDHLR